MKNCPYCGAQGNFYFKISSRTYNRCSGCNLIYKESQDSHDVTTQVHGSRVHGSRLESPARRRQAGDED